MVTPRHLPSRSRCSRSRRQASSSASTGAGSPSAGGSRPTSRSPSKRSARISPARISPSPDCTRVSPLRSPNSRERKLRTPTVFHGWDRGSTRCASHRAKGLEPPPFRSVEGKTAPVLLTRGGKLLEAVDRAVDVCLPQAGPSVVCDAGWALVPSAALCKGSDSDGEAENVLTPCWPSADCSPRAAGRPRR